MTALRPASVSRFARGAAIALLAGATILPMSGCDPFTAATPAIGAARAVSTVYQKGKFRSAHFARYDDVVIAVRQSAEELGLHLRYEQVQGGQEPATILRYRDDTGHRVDFEISPRTEVITWVEVNVGAFGLPSVGQLVLEQISDTLAEMGAYLDQPSPGVSAAIRPY